MNRYLIVMTIALLFSCGSDSGTIIEVPDTETSDSPNILLIIADDMGKDATSGFSEGSIKPTTPNLDDIKSSGLTFNNLWVYPTCSPTRASIITGKYGYDTGVKWAGDALSESENILHNYINQQTDNAYSTAIVGKWHLANSSNYNPETLGMDYYAGILSGTVPDYYSWSFSENGSSSNQTSYATEHLTDLAIDWVNGQNKPWFLWLAYNAPHTPFHAPPSEMHTQGNLPEYAQGSDPIPYFMAAIEAMDYQIGRLLTSMSDEERENTIIIFIGDNGSPNQVAQSPYSRSTVKGTLYQGGINTPMFVSGNGVSRTGIDDNLIASTDLYATIAALAGANISEINDSKSFVPLLTSAGSHRNYQYAEKNDGSEDSWTIRNDSFKLIVDSNGNEEMYSLIDDPYEADNLLNGTLAADQQAAKSELEAELSAIRN